jgi:hypothetical protein
MKSKTDGSCSCRYIARLRSGRPWPLYSSASTCHSSRDSPPGLNTCSSRAHRAAAYCEPQHKRHAAHCSTRCFTLPPSMRLPNCCQWWDGTCSNAIAEGLVGRTAACAGRWCRSAWSGGIWSEASWTPGLVARCGGRDPLTGPAGTQGAQPHTRCRELL